MATQGLVSIRRDDVVIMKVVAGSDGMLAQRLADFLRSHWPLNIEDVYQAALKIGFASEATLVVITPDDVRECDGMSYRAFVAAHPRYAATFQDPHFNPRWEHGTAEHTVVLDL